MEMHLRNGYILVFGGGGGIGKAISARLTEAGGKVLIAGRTESRLAQAVTETGAVGYLVADIADVSRHATFFQQAEEKLGGLSAFVNAAALGTGAFTGRGYEPWDITPEEWDTLSAVNYKGAFFLLRNEIDYLKARGIRGNILNIASNGAYTDIIGSYGSAKLAIVKWTRAFGKRYGHNGIIINGIAPGATLTPMIARYATSADQPYPRHAIERFILPEEIAELAFYLMSNGGEIVCGHTVVADGGDSNAY